MKIKLPDLNDELIEIEVNKDSLELYFTNLLTKKHQTPKPTWFNCAFCGSKKMFPLESSDYLVCNSCWAEEIGEEE
jgi:transcription elongation factor Elf1